MKLKEGFDSNYRYVLVAARRARQLSSGAPPLVHTSTSKTCKIAQEEIAAGKIQYITSDTASTAPAENGEEKKLTVDS